MDAESRPRSTDTAPAPAGDAAPGGRRSRIRRRSALTREQVLVAALRIIDADGVEALTMRRLGAALDRNPMRIYRHAADKDALLDGVVEHVLSALVVRVPGRERKRRHGPIGKPRCVAPRTRSARSPWPIPTSSRSW